MGKTQQLDPLPEYFSVKDIQELEEKIIQTREFLNDNYFQQLSNIQTDIAKLKNLVYIKDQIDKVNELTNKIQTQINNLKDQVDTIESKLSNKAFIKTTEFSEDIIPENGQVVFLQS